VRVEVRLFATLARYLPEDNDAGAACLEVGAGSTVADVARALGIPFERSPIVLLIGRLGHDPHALTAVDLVTLYPPLAGGAGAG
jgi:hypothetical protein